MKTTCILAIAAASVVQPALAQLVVLDQFNPGLGTLVACGHDPTTDIVWVYGNFSPTLSGYHPSGSLAGTLAHPGESADDADIEFAPGALTLGAASVPAGTLLFINGESGVAEIYAVNPATGALLATLATGFGNSHVVGGAYHPGRSSFFLVS